MFQASGTMEELPRSLNKLKTVAPWYCPITSIAIHLDYMDREFGDIFPPGVASCSDFRGWLFDDRIITRSPSWLTDLVDLFWEPYDGPDEAKVVLDEWFTGLQGYLDDMTGNYYDVVVRSYSFSRIMTQIDNGRPVSIEIRTDCSTQAKNQAIS